MCKLYLHVSRYRPHNFFVISLSLSLSLFRWKGRVFSASIFLCVCVCGSSQPVSGKLYNVKITWNQWIRLKWCNCWCYCCCCYCRCCCCWFLLSFFHVDFVSVFENSNVVYCWRFCDIFSFFFSIPLLSFAHLM